MCAVRLIALVLFPFLKLSPPLGANCAATVAGEFSWRCRLAVLPFLQLLLFGHVFRVDASTLNTAIDLVVKLMSMCGRQGGLSLVVRF